MQEKSSALLRLPKLHIKGLKKRPKQSVEGKSYLDDNLRSAKVELRLTERRYGGLPDGYVDTLLGGLLTALAEGGAGKFEAAEFPRPETVDDNRFRRHV